jgi:hypothetical protein
VIVLRRLVSAAVLLAGASCTSAQQEVLEQEVDHATQEQIVARFGSPLYVGRLRDGREVWTYRETGAGYSRDMGVGFCREYVLTFDAEGILRRWERQACVVP